MAGKRGTALSILSFSSPILPEVNVAVQTLILAPSPLWTVTWELAQVGSLGQKVPAPTPRPKKGSGSAVTV